MTETVIATFLFAWLFKGYKWLEIFKLFKHWSIYPIVFTCFAHIYFVYSIIHNQYWFLEYAYYIKTTSFLFYFILIWKYKLLDVSIFKSINTKINKPILVWMTSPVVIGTLCTIVGSKLNQIAMFDNNNKMPVFFSNAWATGYAKVDIFTNASRYGDFHVMGDMYTKLIPLCDTWDAGFMVLSPGDLLCRGFVFMILYYSIKQLRKTHLIIYK